MKKFFYPSSVAIFASIKEGKTGCEIIKNIVEGGFRGKIYPISQSSGGKVFQLEVYSDYQDLEFDLAIIAIPEKFIPVLLEGLGKKEISRIVIISAGFSEIGNREGEEVLKDIARKYQMRVIGPNCAGIINTENNLFTSIEVRALPEEDAFITQSGALGGAVLMMAEELNFGFSKFVSFGNRCDVGEIDPQTKVIALYIESW